MRRNTRGSFLRLIYVEHRELLSKPSTPPARRLARPALFASSSSRSSCRKCRSGHGWLVVRHARYNVCFPQNTILAANLDGSSWPKSNNRLPFRRTEKSVNMSPAQDRDKVESRRPSKIENRPKTRRTRSSATSLERRQVGTLPIGK